MSEVLPGIRIVRPTPMPGSAWEVPNLILIGESKISHDHAGYTLIDAGYAEDDSADKVLEALGQARLDKIIITHGHKDHAGAARKLKQKTGAKVLIHAEERKAIASRGMDVEIEQEVKDLDVIGAQGRELTVLHTPGHAPGHISLWIKREGILISGDLVTGKGSTVVAPPEGNMLRYMKSLKRVRSLPVKTLLPGHGPVPEDAIARIDELIEHREIRELCIAKSLNKGPKTVSQMIEDMYAGLIHPGLHFAAGATIIAHLEKLIEEGKVSSDPEDKPMASRTFTLTVDTRLPF